MKLNQQAANFRPVTLKLDTINEARALLVLVDHFLADPLARAASPDAELLANAIKTASADLVLA